MGEHDGARSVAEMLDEIELGIKALDVVFGFGTALVRRSACGDIEKVGDVVAGKGDVFAKLFFAIAMLPEIAPQRAANEGVATKFQGAVCGEQRGVGGG